MEGELALRQVTSAFDVATILTDGAGVTLWVNEAFTQLCGYHREEIIGLRPGTLLQGPRTDPVVAARLSEAIRRGVATHQTLLNYRKDRTTYWASLHLAPIRAHGVVTHILALIHDVTAEVQATQSLRERAEQLRQLVELAPDTVLIHQDGVILEANRAAAELFNVAGQNVLIGRPLLAFVQRDSHDAILSRLRELASREGPLPRITQRLVRLDGQTVDIEATSARIRYRGQHAVLSIVRDVTARTAAENALHEQQQLLSSIMAATPDLIYLYDVVAQRVVFVDGQGVAALGYTPDMCIGMSQSTIARLIHPDDLPLVAEQLQQLAVAPEGMVVEGDYRVQTASSHWCWLHTRSTCFTRTVVGQPHLVVGVAHNVTERRQLEQELRVAVTRFHVASTLAVDSIYEVDVATGEAMILGGESHAAHGLDVPSLSVSTWEMLLHPEDRERVLAARARLIDTGALFAEEYRLLLPDGVLYLEDRATLLGTPGQPAARMLGITKDVTARKRQEAQQQALEQRLQAAQRLESLGVLAGGVAHQFNNLLTAILGYAELLLADAPADSELHSGLTAILRGARRAAELSTLMLAYSGRGHFVRQPLDLNELLGSLADSQHALAPPHVAVHMTLRASLPPIAGNDNQLQQVIRQLVSNAVEAIGEEAGAVTITTDVTVLEQAALVELPFGVERMPGHYVLLTIHDTGSGMDQATLARIFEPFFTTKFTGRGLGLAAVDGIVRGHQGIIQVQSAVGNGTTVRVLLPVAPQVQEQKPAGAAPQRTRQAMTVLVIDDEEAVRRVTGRMLERLGYSVVAVASGAAGLALLSEGIADLVAVLIDLTLPQLSGDMVAQTIAEQWPTILIILMSGYKAEEIAERFTSLPLAGVVQKPFTLRDLARVLPERNSDPAS